jgi:hypothetical protein
MTLRATEPLFTLLIAMALLKTERVSAPVALALLPIVAGAALSSVESADFNLPGLAIVMACNTLFALRGVVTKRLKSAHEVDNFNLFLQVAPRARPATAAVSRRLAMNSRSPLCSGRCRTSGRSSRLHSSSSAPPSAPSRLPPPQKLS